MSPKEFSGPALSINNMPAAFSGIVASKWNVDGNAVISRIENRQKAIVAS